MDGIRPQNIIEKYLENEYLLMIYKGIFRAKKGTFKQNENYYDIFFIIT